ncbi:penicillin-insensitive murein endopeptidase [Enhygromyxa salina]|uniref:Membrane-bound lytic murein transglycosylase D n=1 Tax=Enhygromyxa salina TaxID=215803 RepID=A0A2S9YTG2_9BACT|nr:penicillin-insensitive murein endopeptidase [Enhygromyxa salina]PRQ08405.1 Membrane-bound lytic murein transglycosylase D precursor [Enhygromyxa salina]
MRSWSSLLLIGALVTVSAAADGRRELMVDSPPSLEPQGLAPARQPKASPPPVEKSTWFDITEPPDVRPRPLTQLGSEPLPRWIHHQSLPRDTIEIVAIRYGVSARDLRRWNGMSPRGRLHPSRPGPLRVRARRLPPPREQLIHIAAKGDTWDSLGRRHAVFDRHLQAWNKDEIGWTLEPGERVSVWVEPMVRDAARDEGPAAGRAALIPPRAHSIGTPQSGRLIAGVQVPPGEGYERRYPNSSWGTTFAVRHLVVTLDEFHRTSGYLGTLMLGSMSFRRGGKIGPHISHQSGRDIDIRLPIRAGVRASQPVKPESVDWAAAWELIAAFARSGAVKVIFLDYAAQRELLGEARRLGVSETRLAELFQFPGGRHANRGLVRHSPGHEGHIHVRYACGPFEPVCGD